MDDKLVKEFDSEKVNIKKLSKAKIDSVDDILDAIDMKQYKQKFKDELIGIEAFFFLTDDHLMKLGLGIHDRVKLLRCLQIIKDTPPMTPSTMDATIV